MVNDLHHLAAAYVLDALDDAERRAFEDHYPTCEICQQEVTEFRSTAAHLAAAAAATPPAALQQRVMAEIATTRQLAPLSGPVPVDELAARRNRRFASVLAVAAAVILLVGASVFIVSSRGGSAIDDVVAAPDAQVVQLEGETGSVRVVWSPSREQLAVFGNDLPDPGEGKTYELWGILGDAGVRSVGQFDPVDGTVREVADVGDMAPTAWGITIEPDGGSPAPTTDIIFISEV
jgi:anti-sigma-K factor RskA